KNDRRTAAESLKAAAGRLPQRQRIDATTLPPGVSAMKSSRELIERNAREIDKADANDSAKRALVVASLGEVADRIAAEALMSLAYAVDMGDGDSPALLAGIVAMRHDCGLGLRVGIPRVRDEW